MNMKLLFALKLTLLHLLTFGNAFPIGEKADVDLAKRCTTTSIGGTTYLQGDCSGSTFSGNVVQGAPPSPVTGGGSAGNGSSFGATTSNNNFGSGGSTNNNNNFGGAGTTNNKNSNNGDGSFTNDNNNGGGTITNNNGPPSPGDYNNN